MIAPQVPTGGLIRQAVLDDESNRQRNNAMGVMGLGQGVFGHVRVEVLPTARAPMLRVNQMNIARSPGNQIAHVMEDASGGSAAKTGLATARTRAMGKVASAMDDLGFGQIFGSRDAFRDVRHILSGARHSKALLGQLV
jgi:hypothetical protein